MIGEYVHIQYEDGSNPYICKTEEEFLRLRVKYGKRMQKIKDGFYLVKKETIQDSFKEEE